MDGLISSLQYSNSNTRFTSFQNEKNEDGKANKNNAKNAQQNVLNTDREGNHLTVTDREGNHLTVVTDRGGNGKQDPQSSQQDFATNGINTTQFGNILGETIATEAIVNKALEIAQSIRNAMNAFGLEATLREGGFEESSVSKSMQNLHLQFYGMLVSGSTAQQAQQVVNVNIAFSTSFIETNFSSSSFSFSANSTNSFNFSLSNTQVQAQITTQNALTNVSLVDPLVIDLGGDGVELSTDHFEFDLDSDGESDQISRPKGNSGFLALDKNGDGKINNGNELFGAKTGDGFKDLAAYDSNNDNKIDKNDPIYDKLRIWKPTAQGNGKLIGLGEVGIGTIYLNAHNNEQLFQSQSGEILGVQRKTAQYERTDGSTGRIHHIDLAKRNNQNEQKEDLTQKQKGMAAYKQSQGELERLRFLNNAPQEDSALSKHYDKMMQLNKNNLGLLGINKEDIAQKIEAIKNGNIDEYDIAMIKLDALLSNKQHNGLASLLNQIIFDNQLGTINQTFFQYEALLKAQKLLG